MHRLTRYILIRDGQEPSLIRFVSVLFTTQFPVRFVWFEFGSIRNFDLSTSCFYKVRLNEYWSIDLLIDKTRYLSVSKTWFRPDGKNVTKDISDISLLLCLEPPHSDAFAWRLTSVCLMSVCLSRTSGLTRDQRGLGYALVAGKTCDFRLKSPFFSETVCDRPTIATERAPPIRLWLMCFDLISFD